MEIPTNTRTFQPDEYATLSAPDQATIDAFLTIVGLEAVEAIQITVTFLTETTLHFKEQRYDQDTYE